MCVRMIDAKDVPVLAYSRATGHAGTICTERTPRVWEDQKGKGGGGGPAAWDLKVRLHNRLYVRAWDGASLLREPPYRACMSGTAGAVVVAHFFNVSESSCSPTAAVYGGRLPPGMVVHTRRSP